MKNKSTFLLGLLAAASTVSFMYKFSKEKNTDINSGIEGLNIEINPSVLVDSLKPIVLQKVNPQYRDALATVTKGIVEGYMGRNKNE